MQPETMPSLPPAVVEVAGKSYLPDAKGNLIPVEAIRAADKLEDETVRKVMAFAVALSEQVARFKTHTFADLNGFQALLEQEYGARAGGAKGNVSFQTFDGLMKIQVQIADQISFGPQLQEAKKLIDECLREWGAESKAELRALVNRVFSVEKEGQINKAELFSLLRVEIEDPRWRRAMDAVRDAIRVTGTKQYVRFYRRDDPNAEWRSVKIDLAAA
jgi:hypothetical protein